jgi:hypothetical protein
MVVIPDRASQRNNSQIIPLSRPRIERAVDCDGFNVLRDDHGWLVGDRRQALREFAGLVDIERWGRA